MKYLLRIKGVSECMGIRRMSLAYSLFGNGIVNLINTPHPINSFKELEINGDEITVLDSTQRVTIGQEEWFSFNHPVNSSSGTITERLDLRVMVIPLVKDAIEYYLKAIEEGYFFDSMDGEFEYIIGLIYELELNDINTALNYYMKAKEKRFNYELIRKAN